MTVNFPKEIDPVVRAKASAHGFGEDVQAYLLHLVQQDQAAKLAKATPESALEAFERLGLVGCIEDGPSDLSTNPKYLEGFGQDEQPQNDAGWYGSARRSVQPA